ncbi:hypothetical protein [Chitinophaga ginsengisegetis]|uniref:hypothetical protein n=1 Tax=Chitinophaga ginsengisegetis TaxID=393003 RepID=UPI000DB94F8B|nr:hypothetical protein [Chitinophaga ginsengisegetis]MDR6569840.1 YD repeat-containing protein [Chitinophaga ginsengisegetis]MDR6649573.1 YD repeat-containing protein [Chitinophaga ginsengisegetis]MDR6655923.1 YD repeat-containing protein [Chitinophaga ginsengisegetis]
MKKILTNLFSCLLFPFLLKAQSEAVTLPKLITPSPEAASITKYGIYPVSLFTGLPSISIPVYNIAVRNFTLPISFDYHAAGIKVDDYASWVGIGWSLNAGGAITRTVIGVPDDDSYGSFYYPIKRENAITGDDYNALIDITDRKRDSEPDIFYYNVAGLSGKFVFGPNKEIRSIPHNNLKINYSGGIFSIVDHNGTTYWFEKKGTSSSYPEFGGIKYWPVTSWLLTKIILDNKVDTISFDYVGYNQGRRQTIDYSLSLGRAPRLVPMSCPDGTSGCQYVSFSSSFVPVRSINYQEFEDYYPSKITFPGGKIRFVAGKNERLDFGGLILDSIIAENNTRPVKRMALTHDYFYSDEGYNFFASIRDKYRLKLTGINEVGNNQDSVLRHKMEYEEQYKLPPRMNCGIDWWGYSNGHPENQQLISLDEMGRQYSYSDIIGYTTTSVINPAANREPDENNMRAGILKRIYYPTGGYTDFEFEANRILAPKTESDPGGSYFIAAKKDDPPNVTYRTVEFISPVTIGINDPLPAELRLIIPLWTNATQPYVLFENLTTGASVRYTTVAGEQVSRTIRVALTAGQKYKITANIYPDPSDPNDDTDDEVLVTLTWAGRGTHQITIVQKGPGLRVKSIKSYTAESKLAKQEDYKYGENESGNGNVSFITSLFQSRTYEQNYTFCWTSSGFDPKIHSQPYSRLEILSKPIFSYSDIGGSSIFYPIVTKYEIGEGSDNGKTIYRYDYELDEKIDAHYPDPQLLVSAGWKSGNLISESTYKKKDNGYQLISETKNTYQTYFFDTTYGLKVRQKIIYTAGRNCINEGLPGGYRFSDDFGYFEYPVVSGVKKLLTSASKTFTDNNDSLSSITSYSYQNLLHLLPTTIETLNSKGVALKNIFKYPQDKAGITGMSAQESIAVDSLVSKNMIEKLVEKEEYENNMLVQKAHYEYSIWGSTKYLVALKKFKLKLGSAPSEDRFEIIDYDKFGNILEQSNSNNIHEVYLWGYNDLYPVAKVLNSSYPVVKSLINPTITQNPVSDIVLQTELDKLRNSTTLSNSFINTYSYVPLLGLSGTKDEAGRNTYYEYDGFGRLKLIKDQNGKILKLIDYQYQQALNK